MKEKAWRNFCVFVISRFLSHKFIPEIQSQIFMVKGIYPFYLKSRRENKKGIHKSIRFDNKTRDIIKKEVGRKDTSEKKKIN